MRRTLAVLFASLFCLPVFASKLNQLSLDELDNKTKYVVLGYVEEIVKSDEVSDTIKIRIVSILKGMFHTRGDLQIVLQNKGELKKFDPVLKRGEIAIFMLGADFKLAYPGSIATFPKSDNFKVNSIELSEEQIKAIEALKNAEERLNATGK